MIPQSRSNEGDEKYEILLTLLPTSPGNGQRLHCFPVLTSPLSEQTYRGWHCPDKPQESNREIIITDFNHRFK